MIDMSDAGRLWRHRGSTTAEDAWPTVGRIGAVTGPMLVAARHCLQIRGASWRTGRLLLMHWISALRLAGLRRRSLGGDTARSLVADRYSAVHPAQHAAVADLDADGSRVIALLDLPSGRLSTPGESLS